MIRQLCNHCLKLVELPDDSPGKSLPCPLCGGVISVPALYAPSVAPGGGLAGTVPPTVPVPAPPPPPPPPTPEAETYGVLPASPPPPFFTASPPPPPAPPPPPGVAPAAPPPGFNPNAFAPQVITPAATVTAPTGTRLTGFTLSPTILDWVPVAGIILAFILTFFPWVGAYPGGVGVFKQSAWDILGAGMSVNAPTPELQKTAEWLEKDVNGLDTDWMLLPYILLLFVTLGLAVVERLFQNPNILTIPGPLAWLPTIWPRRYLLLTALTGLLLLFFVGHTIRGKALPGAIERQATLVYKAKIDEADTTVKKQEAQVLVGQEIGKYVVTSTTFRALAFWAHVVALLGMIARWWLASRGAKPLPRILLQT